MIRKIFKYIFIISLGFAFSNCEGVLDEEVYSELAADNLLQTEDGIESVLYSVFGTGYVRGYELHDFTCIANWCTDIEWETSGNESYTSELMTSFTWDAETTWLKGIMWNQPYRAIRNANSIIDNVDDADISDSKKTIYKAEARFMRAFCYTILYDLYGPVPLRTSNSDESDLPRASDDEIVEFIETELTEVAPQLPFPGEESEYGRPNRGAALALLCKFYLNQQQWDSCAVKAQEVMDLNYYELFNDSCYADMFKVENELNKEYILVSPNEATDGGNNYINGAFPSSFAKDPNSGLEMLDNWNNWAAQYRLYDSFYNSFDSADTRKDCILTEYINTSGDTISLLDDDNTRSFKFWPDEGAVGNNHGNDMPWIRYADILLSRAEALNNLHGPTQEAIDLINMVRERAGVEDLQLADFSTTQSLNDHLLNERAWEFYTEAMIRREDQIRMGTFVSSAVERGYAAEEYHVLFPIPQDEIDANSAISEDDQNQY